jgi:UDP-N-acetylmuramoyl-L-alanyl-D-glutamate--2,6-diaminopimelate ligase
MSGRQVGSAGAEGRYILPNSVSAPMASAPRPATWHQLLAVLEQAGLGGSSRVHDRDVVVTDVVHDSRVVTEGACFVCLPGTRSDGHEHAAAAWERGAVALLVEHPVAVALPQAEVASTRRALGPLASALWGEPSLALRCLGVTGTNGKTTTTHLLESIALAAGERAGVIGTVGARSAGVALDVRGAGAHTTPEADDLHAMLARMRADGVGTVAMEVSSHALVQHRVDGVRFAAVCFTNLTHEHLDYHGSMEAYFAAKAMLFDPARAAVGVVGIDDPHGARLRTLATERGLDTWTFGLDAGDADVGARALACDRRGSAYLLVDRRGGRAVEITSPLVGRFNVANCLAAAATGLAAGFSLEAVADGLRAPAVVPGRMERVSADDAPVTVLVDYAHTPDALDHVLRAGRQLLDQSSAQAGGAPASRLLVVFGCGGDRDREKRPLMGEVVGRRADVAVLTSDNPRSEDPEAIADEVLGGLVAGTASVIVELDRAAAIDAALAAARPGDVVVVAGKGHETGQTAAGVTIPFDDREVARAALVTHFGPGAL